MLVDHRYATFIRAKFRDLIFDFIECFTTTFLRAHSWLNLDAKFRENCYKEMYI